jgi:hypothetical protein
MIPKTRKTGKIDKSVLTHGTPNVVRDRKYLDSFQHEACWMCGSTPCVAAHVRYQGSGGMGTKPSDYYTWPLCSRPGGCHDEFDGRVPGDAGVDFVMRWFMELLKRRYWAWKEQN